MLSSVSSQAVFFGLAACYLASICVVDLFSDGLRVPFLHTEWLCWVLLLALAQLTQHSERFGLHDDKNHADKLALAIAAVCLCWTVGDARWAVVRSLYSTLFSPVIHCTPEKGGQGRGCRRFTNLKTEIV